jgi:tetratricopeptide (TPR) repeat protein
MASMGVELQFAYNRTGEWRKYPKLAKIVELIERTGKESETFGMLYHPYPILVCSCGIFAAMTGNFRDGTAYCQKGLRLAQVSSNLLSLAGAEMSYGSLLCHKGDGKNALPYIEKAIHHFEEAQIVTMLPQAWYYLGLANILLGDHRTALSNIETGLDIQQKSGLVFYKSLFYQMSGRAYLELGEFDKAWSSLNEGLKDARADKERSAEGRILIYLGTVQQKLAASEGGQAEDLIRHGIRILEDLELKPLHSIGYLHLGELYADTERKQEALEALNTAKAAFQEMGMDYYLARTEKALEKLQT